MWSEDANGNMNTSNLDEIAGFIGGMGSSENSKDENKKLISEMKYTKTQAYKYSASTSYQGSTSKQHLPDHRKGTLRQCFISY